MSYSLSFIFNVVLLILVIYHFRRKVVQNQQQGKSAKNWFSCVYVSVAILISVYGYEWVALVYEFYGVSIDHGHAGIAYLASGVVNIIIGFVGIIFGRIIIGWKSSEY
ncbi:MAG: hypothetical protein V7784_05630 [Oceanospirillaceae bacterium]